MSFKKEFSILVADDVRSMRKLLVKILKLNGFSDIQEAENGQQAIEFIKQSIPDLVLVDWYMPGKNGLEVLQSIRNNRETKNIPFIMISCEATATSIETALQSGANEYVDKPFERTEIIEKVNKLLNIPDPALSAV